MSETQLAELTASLVFAPFEVTYGPLRSFLPHPGVVYDVGPQESFRALRAALHVTSAFREHVPVRQAVAFHMTIAEFISTERTVELLDELAGNVPTGVFTCGAVEYAVPDERFRFPGRQRLTFTRQPHVVEPRRGDPARRSAPGARGTRVPERDRPTGLHPGLFAPTSTAASASVRHRAR